jgi:hypothetical protein
MGSSATDTFRWWPTTFSPRTLRLLLALVAVAVLAATSVQAAPVGRGGVTPADIPWNKHPLPKTTASFAATPAGKAGSTTSTAAKLALIIGISDYSGDSRHGSRSIRDADGDAERPGEGDSPSGWELADFVWAGLHRTNHG